MKFVFAANHTGQARALEASIASMDLRGHEVYVFLQGGGPAAALLRQNKLLFPGAKVHEATIHDDGGFLFLGERKVFERAAAEADRVMTMLSPSDADVVTVETLLREKAIARGIHTYAYAEVPCGHMGAPWRGLLSSFTKLFVAQKTTDLETANNVVEVGFGVPIINPLRALYTKARLGFAMSKPFIWYSGGPYPQAGDILERLVSLVHHINSMQGYGLSIVFTRHGRDKEDPDCRAGYERAVGLASQVGVLIVENSLDHLETETTAVQRQDLLPYALLLEAATQGGVIVTGHGTDGMFKAPRLCVPSIGCVGDSLNPHLRIEKGCEVLPLPLACPFQITDLNQLSSALNFSLIRREEYVMRCAAHYSLQDKSPAQIIAEHLVAV